MKGVNKIIFNTGVLYLQLFIKLIIGLFTTSIVLNALGATDYGIYMLVAGMVGMLGILNSSMSNTSMRFLSHSLGSGNKDRIIKTFNTTLYIHFLLGLIVIVFMEVGGWLMFEFLLAIPDNKIFDAKVVFQLMIFTTFISIISVPYDAVTNAHEDLLALAIIDLLNTLINFGVAIYMMNRNGNLLLLYGFCMLAVQVLIRIVKQQYAQRNYDECRHIYIKQYKDKQLVNEILSFSGWNLLGSIAAVSSTKVRGILINMFFGVKLNAGEGIATQTTSQINMVSANLARSVLPQVNMSEGGGERGRMILLTEISSKYSALVFALFGIPFFLETDYILKIWLKNVPQFAAIFTQFLIITMVLEKFTSQIGNSIRAVGNIRNYQIAEPAVIVSSIPLAYFTFKFGGGPVSIYIIGVIIVVLTSFIRLYYGKTVVGIQIYKYFKNVIIPTLIPICLAIIVVFPFRYFMIIGILRMSIVTLVYIVVLLMMFVLFGMTQLEKNIFINIIILTKTKFFQQK